MNKNFPVLPVEIWDMIDVIRRREFKRRVAEFEIESRIYMGRKWTYVSCRIPFNYEQNYKIMREVRSSRRDLCCGVVANVCFMCKPSTYTGGCVSSPDTWPPYRCPYARSAR